LRKSTGVLKNAFRTGVVDESISSDQPFLHQHLAPGTEAIGEFGSGRLWESRHVSPFFLSEVTLSTDCG
jgi:hypothetical protein